MIPFVTGSHRKIDESLPFISEWKTDNRGVSNSDQITLPLLSAGVYNFTVDWGDSTQDTITSWNQAEVTHTYPAAGTYTVTIIGILKGWSFNPGGDRGKIIDISQWGVLDFYSQFTGVADYFIDCVNLDISATDAPILENTTSLGTAFFGCSSLTTPDFSQWDTSKVTNMNFMFTNCTNFNGDISTWDVSGVNSFLRAFLNCSSFNQPLNDWDVSGVNSINSFAAMFSNCTSFNQDLDKWDTSNALNMSNMFQGCTNFNGDVSTWDTGNVTNMGGMFQNCVNFNQDLDQWDTSKVTNMNSMFNNCRNFNGDVTTLDVSEVINMQSMFRLCSNFNQNIGVWDVSNVTNMSTMFQSAVAFDQDIGDWNISSVTNFTNFMAGKNNSNYSAANLDSIYNKWSLLTVQPNININFNTIKYNSTSQAGRDVLTSAPNNWTINDGGQV